MGTVLTLFAGVFTPACKDDVDLGGPHTDPSGSDVGTITGACGTTHEVDAPLVPTNKIDILFAVDNSASMGDKAEVLAKAADPLVRRLSPGRDVHVGVLTSSLGGVGGDVCSDDEYGASGLRLSTKVKDGKSPAEKTGFLSLSPTNGGTNVGAITALDAFAKNVSKLIIGADQTGCGLENQLESVYRFLVEPDPWQRVVVGDGDRASYDGVDEIALAQRAAFLRPDSLVLVVLLTDEEDGSLDPLSFDGMGWAFASNRFPSSPVIRDDGKGTTAPHATSVCATAPLSPDCTSCGLAATCDVKQEACQRIRNDPNCQGVTAFYPPDDDSLNVRFFAMKERFGVDPRFPVGRYVDGFTKRHLPNRDGTLTNCTNPLFAAALPTSADDGLCCLPEGTRSRELVMFTTISGIVPGLVTNGRPDWEKAVGRAPEKLDYTGIDPHMRSSIGPREGLAPPSSVHGDNGPDPVHGREWDTKKNDLQYACTFKLPTPDECNSTNKSSCECGNDDVNPPVCAAATLTTAETTRTRGKAYPALRPLLVAKGLGDRAVVGSICPTDIERGYFDTVDAIESRALSRLTY